MSARRHLTRVLLLVSALVTPLASVRAAHAAEPPATAMKPEARVHLEQGLAAYGDKDWERAIREFRTGYEIEPRAEFLFAWAQAERLSGDCAGAIEIYELFLATKPAVEQANAARQMSDRCRETVAATDPAAEAEAEGEPGADSEPGTDSESGADAEPTSSASLERTWWNDGWGAGFAAAGVVGLAMGLGFVVAADSSEDASDRAASYDQYASLKDEAGSRRTIAAVSLATGASFLVASGVRYWVVRKRDEGASGESTGVALSVTPAGAALWFGGSF